MADRDKVIKGLGECLEVLANHVPERYLGYSAGACLDAIELLKRQEPVPPKKVNRYIDYDDDGWPYTPDTYDCGWCGEELPWMLDTAIRQTKHYKPNYCPDCGKKVKWGD